VPGNRPLPPGVGLTPLTPSPPTPPSPNSTAFRRSFADGPGRGRSTGATGCGQCCPTPAPRAGGAKAARRGHSARCIHAGECLSLASQRWHRLRLQHRGRCQLLKLFQACRALDAGALHLSTEGQQVARRRLTAANTPGFRRLTRPRPQTLVEMSAHLNACSTSDPSALDRAITVRRRRAKAADVGAHLRGGGEYACSLHPGLDSIGPLLLPGIFLRATPRGRGPLQPCPLPRSAAVGQAEGAGVAAACNPSRNGGA
jgi:hypothetical protein